MSNNYVYLWTRKEYEFHNAKCQNESLQTRCILEHAASNQFIKRGIEKGDQVYIVACFENTLFLMGKLRIDNIYSARDASRRLNRKLSEVNWATDHIIVDRNIAGAMRFDLIIPTDRIRKLRFIKNGSANLREPKFKDPISKKYVEPQTFRGIRQITDESAELLDNALKGII